MLGGLKMLTQKYKEFSKLIIYQIYPRSFKDSNGDGIGDLGGIKEKLPYLKELGVNAIWICPCYKSPNVDNGYDISDYRDIMDEFGTLNDMKELISSAHDIGIKIIMDLVPNHTSSEHKWFKESKKSKNNKYSDYYYWFDEPPNKWTSCFGGTAWEYCEERGQYYLHSYAKEQPDLNFTNPNVLKEIQDVIDYWANLGVDGFRCDVIDQISKNFSGANAFGPHLHQYINALFGRKNVEHLFTVGECWANSLEEMCRHCSAERKELTTLFQFEHISLGRKNKYEPKEQSLKDFRDILLKWQKIADENDLLYSLFSDNHDNSFFLSRMGDVGTKRYESATCIAAMLYTLRGIPFIYQGQEFGMIAPKYDSIDDFDDIETINFYKYNIDALGKEETLKKINFGSRDNTRRPMCWNGEEFGGFSSVSPWTTLHSEYKNINLKKDRESEKSIFNFYKALLKLRSNSPAILYGSLNVLSKDEDSYFVFEREYEGEKITVICNFEEENNFEIPQNAEILLSNYKDRASKMRPYEILILKEKEA